MTLWTSQEEEWHTFAFDYITHDKDDDNDDSNPYPIIVQYANLGLWKYQIEDVSYNI